MEETIKVLAVDDDRTACVLYQAIGQRFGFEICVVDSSVRALDALHSAQFDLVLMDWRLPDIDGMECTRMIRKEEAGTGRHLPIIAVTAYALRGDREQCLAAGVDDYVSKPFNLSELGAKIRQLVSGSTV